MIEKSRTITPEELAENAWEKAVIGKRLTPSESNALQSSKGIYIPPTESEKPIDSSEFLKEEPQEIVRETQKEVQTTMERRCVCDLVTGERLVSIPLHYPTPQDAMRITPNDLKSLPADYEAGRHADIRLLVEELDRVLFPGFVAALLSLEERSQLENASPELMQKIHKQLTRLILADKTRTMIEKISHAIDTHLVPLVPRIRNTHARQSIESCIDIWKANSANPYLNFYERTTRIAEEDDHLHTEYRIPLALQDPRFISVGIVEGHLDVLCRGAAYSVSTRVMFIREPAHDREMDFFETLSVLHELTHIKHDAQVTQKLDIESAAYQNRTGQVPSDTMVGAGVIEEDPEAIGNEIEAVIAKTGTGTINTHSVARCLGVSIEQKENYIDRLLRYARHYYPQGRGQNGVMSQQFIDFVEEEYRRHGAIIFQHDERGCLVQKK